jgi:hypothetical protein
MKKQFFNIILSLTLAVTLFPISSVQAATLTKTQNINEVSFTYDNKKLPKDLKSLIPKGLEDKAIVKHIGKVDVITLPKGEHFSSTKPASKITSDSLMSSSVPSNGGIKFQDYDNSYKILMRGVENHHDGTGVHFNINTQYRNGGDIHDYHITSEGKSWFSDKYTWKMSDNARGFEEEIVAYGAEEDAAYDASHEIIAQIAAEDGEAMGVLAEGGVSVLIDLLLLLL